MAEPKELQVVKEVNSSLYRIKFEGGGELPKALSGRYTSTKLAQDAINNYLAQRDTKPNGKTTSSKGV